LEKPNTRNLESTGRTDTSRPWCCRHTARRRTEVETVPVDQVQRLLLAALRYDLELLPFSDPRFFLRNRARWRASRLRWEDVHLVDRTVVMRAEITKKNQCRMVDLQLNAIEWLLRCPNRTGAVVKLSDSTLGSRRRSSRTRCGIAHLPHSGMRHTFCSPYLNHFKDQAKLMLHVGHNNPEVLHTHYFKVLSSEEAFRFWNIVPRATEKIVQFAKVI
jgi:integrase